jgi:hypothetical protein
MARSRAVERRNGVTRARGTGARPRWWGSLAALMRLRGERADRPRRIDRLIDYFGDQRAQPARG